MNEPSKEIPEDLARALRAAFREGVVEFVPDEEDSWFPQRARKLRAEFKRISTATIGYERDGQAEPMWDENEDPDGFPADNLEPARAYHVFFLVPHGTDFRRDCTAETTDEDSDEWLEVRGREQIGLTVAVSLIAPYAMVRPGHLIDYDDGTRTAPDLAQGATSEDGEPLPPEWLEETLSEKALAKLGQLRARVKSALAKVGIAVVSEAVAGCLVPGLERGEEVIGYRDYEDTQVSVMDALFYRGLV